MQPLAGVLVADLSRYLPGAFATRQLLRLGARVVRVEAPAGDPMREHAAWHEELNGGKESVVCDLDAEPELLQALAARADVVVESFRPGVLARRGIEPPPRTVWVSITGFGEGNRHERRAGHDLNYLGWAGVLEDAVPPATIADYAGGYAAVREALAGLLLRERTGEGSRRVVSMTHEAYELAVPPLLRGSVACYRLYETADGRLLSVAALEQRFFRRLCEIAEVPSLAQRQYEPRLPELEAALAARPLAEWLDRFEGEDVCAGPVRTREEAQELAPTPAPPAPELGEHTEAWRRELGL